MLSMHFTSTLSTHGVRRLIAVVTLCDVTANQHHAAHSIPHFTFHILHAAVLHFTHSVSQTEQVLWTRQETTVVAASVAHTWRLS